QTQRSQQYPSFHGSDPLIPRLASAPWTLANRPPRVQLRHRRNDLVVAKAERVAARAQVLGAHLVDRDLDRRADERRDELAIVDVVRPRGTEGAPIRCVAGQARQLHLPAHVPQLELALIGGGALRDVYLLGGSGRALLAA